jgi:hypothetical protein
MGVISGAKLDHISVCRGDIELEPVALAVRVRCCRPDLHPLTTAQNVCDQ